MCGPVTCSFGDATGNNQPSAFRWGLWTFKDEGGDVVPGPLNDETILESPWPEMEQPQLLFGIQYPVHLFHEHFHVP